jgi:SMC interacting uncharacterized protein involved in chromosome segregation
MDLKSINENKFWHNYTNKLTTYLQTQGYNMERTSIEIVVVPSNKEFTNII